MDDSRKLCSRTVVMFILSNWRALLLWMERTLRGLIGVPGRRTAALKGTHTRKLMTDAEQASVFHVGQNKCFLPRLRP